MAAEEFVTAKEVRARLASPTASGSRPERGGMTSTVTSLEYRERDEPTPQVCSPAELVQRLRVALPGWTVEAWWPDGVGAVVASVPLAAEVGGCRMSSWERIRLGVHTMIAIVALRGSPVAAANLVNFFDILSRWTEAEA